MQETIATIDYSNHEIVPECLSVFHLGVKVIEKEFKTSIQYDIDHKKSERKAELKLLNTNLQSWLQDSTSRDIIVYKLVTHLKICLGQFEKNKLAADNRN